MTLAFADPFAALYWPFFRLVDAGWAGIPDMHRLTLDEVGLAGAALDALEDARATKDP